MARRRKKRRGGKSKSIPVAPVLPVIAVTWDAYKSAGGLNEAFPKYLMYKTTGYSVVSGDFNADRAKGFWFGELAGIVVHKVANKTGLNRYVRKMTMGYLTL